MLLTLLDDADLTSVNHFWDLVPLVLALYGRDEYYFRRVLEHWVQIHAWLYSTQHSVRQQVDPRSNYLFNSMTMTVAELPILPRLRRLPYVMQSQSAPMTAAFDHDRRATTVRCRQVMMAPRILWQEDANTQLGYSVASRSRARLPLAHVFMQKKVTHRQSLMQDPVLDQAEWFEEYAGLWAVMSAAYVNPFAHTPLPIQARLEIATRRRLTLDEVRALMVVDEDATATS